MDQDSNKYEPFIRLPVQGRGLYLATKEEVIRMLKRGKWFKRSQNTAQKCEGRNSNGDKG